MGSFVHWIQEELLKLRDLTKSESREAMDEYGFGKDQSINNNFRKKLCAKSRYLHYVTSDVGVCYFHRRQYLFIIIKGFTLPYINKAVLKIQHGVFYKGRDSIAFRMYSFLKQNPIVLEHAPNLSWTEDCPINTWYSAAISVSI